jgi:hypothetical protein
MRKTICTLFLMLITVSVFAQSPTWYGQIPAYTRKSTFSTRSFVNNESAVTTRGTIRGKIVTVPSEEAGTIQEAVNLRPSTISLSPGKYDENIFIPSYMSVTIRPEIPGTVIIDGGTNGNTIYLNPEASVVLYHHKKRHARDVVQQSFLYPHLKLSIQIYLISFIPA